MAKITVSSGISYEIKGDILTVEIDLSANPNAITKSGKNHMVATTGPAVAISGGSLVPGAKLQINLYEPRT